MEKVKPVLSLISFKNKSFSLEVDTQTKKLDLFVEVELNEKENITKKIVFEQYHKLNDLTHQTLLGIELNKNEEFLKAVKAGLFYQSINIHKLIEYFKQSSDNDMDLLKKVQPYIDFLKGITNEKAADQIKKLESELHVKSTKHKEEQKNLKESIKTNGK